MTLPIDLHGYTITNKAYDGSETVVYRGRRNSDSTAVAIKLTRNDYPTARELGRLRREFGIIKDIGHLPGVVEAYSLEKFGRGLALVMEDLGDTSLHQALQDGPLDVMKAIEVAISIADTLESLHRLSVIHKDIKPHNIMVGPALSTPRLIDFGISARLSQETQRAASPTALEGTLAYMSPEQTGRMNRSLDRRTDLYSLGVTLYEMLTGALLFQSSDPTEIVHGHIARTPIPPHERAAGVPRGLSDVVMKLLAKVPEERYQTARGLKTDLEACLSRFTASGRIEPFSLGRKDISDELSIPHKLYGRETEVEMLLLGFESARKGMTGLILVSGNGGVGKSALVNEIHKPIARKGGAFVQGKFDEVSRSVPLAPVAHAFRELIRQILAEPPVTLAAWKTKLLEAVGNNGRLLFDLIPELELVLGPQPEPPALAPFEAKNRWSLLVQRFVHVFATADHPLVLFLDDLQWADEASLELLAVLLDDQGLLASGTVKRPGAPSVPRGKHLLILGAYRGNEVDATHPLVAALGALRKTGTPITEIELGPLDLGTTTVLVADALRARAADVVELAEVVFDKTGGNAFFVGQFLGALHQAKLLSLDADAGAFTWDITSVRAAMSTENVIDLMVARLSRLSPTARRALRFAACIGHEFDLGTLSTIAERSPADAARDLWEPLREGLIVPLDDDYRLLDESADDDESASAHLHVTYRFLHDRVLEAAYSLIEQERKAEVHLSIGRLLWARSGATPRDEDLLEIVRHLNLGIGGVADPAERAQIAALDLRAGRRAKAAAAYQAARGFFDAGAALLGEQGWDRAYELCLALHAEGAECAYLHGDIEQADARFDALLPRAKTDLERARIHGLRVVLYTTLGKFTEAMKTGLAGLALLGVKLPSTPEEARVAFDAGLAEVAKNLGDRRVDDLIDAPAMDDPERRMIAQLLSDIAITIYNLNPALYSVLLLERVNISLRHGHSNLSAIAYISYGVMLAILLGDPVKGHAFGVLALALNEKLPNAALTPKIHILFASFVHLIKPLRLAIYHYERARQAAQEVGDLVHLVAVLHAGLTTKFSTGYQLEELGEEVDRNLAIAQRAKDRIGTLILTNLRQVIANLTGKTVRRDTLTSEGFDEDRFLADVEPHKAELAAVVFQFHVFKLQLAYVHGFFELAVAEGEKAERASANVFANAFVTHIYFYSALAHLALPPAREPEQAAHREAEIERHKAKIATLTATCPHNYHHELLLIEAESARTKGQIGAAIELYDEAIALARAHEFPQHEALAHERAARMYAAQGKIAAARGYMGNAYLGYLHWGATAKAEDLARDHADLLPLLGVGGSHRSARSSTVIAGTTILNGALISSLRDAALVVRATQAIAGEIMLPKVIERLAKIVLENASAQRGALLLSREGRLFVEATFSADPMSTQVGPRVPLDAQRDLAESVALFVARTREVVVIDDAREAGRFAADPHIESGAVRSILCLPLVHQGRLSGLLYLEHKDVPAAFTAARVELLELFASQAAIAIENAILVADVQEANEQVRRVNERLEADVAERTEMLVSMNRELGEANQRLSVELAQRERVEGERTMLQERMIEAQRSRLQEMSTPLIPITDRIVVMPIIGTVDAERAQQVLEAALDGAQRHGARVVILDITGMKHIDTHVVSSILRTAAALRLLGTEAVLTGTRSEVAQAMVALGVDLSAIVTKGTLRSGIAYALARSGEIGTLAGTLQRR